MMGTVWLRLKPDQESIVPITNAIVRLPILDKVSEVKTNRISFLEGPLCRSWQWPMFLLSLRTEARLSRKEPMACTEPLPL